MLRKIFGHSVLYTIANHLPLIANIIILPIITPFLTKFDYGIYGLTYAYLGGFSAFSLLGIHVLLQNSFFKIKKQYKQIWSKYLGILFIWRIIYSIIILIVFHFIFHNKVGDNIDLFLLLIIIPILFFDLTKTLGTRYCQYEEKHQWVYISSLIASFFAITTSFICIYYLRLGYLGFLISAAVSAFIQFIFYFFLVHIKLKILPNFNIDIRFLKETLKTSLPVIPHSFFGYLLNSSDRLVLDFNKISLQQIGGYNLAYNFSNYFESFNNSMNSVLSPIYFKCFALEDQNKSKNLVNSLTVLWFTFLLIMSLLLCIWCKEIFNFLYKNPDFDGVYVYVPFILVGMMYRPFYVCCVDKNIFLEKTKNILLVSGGGGTINLVLNLIFVPFYGIEAVLYTTFFSYLYIGFSGFYIRSLKNNIDFAYNPIIFIIIILSTLLFGVLIRDAALLFKVSLTVIIFIFMILLYRFKISKFIKDVNQENLL